MLELLNMQQTQEQLEPQGQSALGVLQARLEGQLAQLAQLAQLELRVLLGLSVEFAGLTQVLVIQILTLLETQQTILLDI
jgi:hypothetical protein